MTQKEEFVKDCDMDRTHKMETGDGDAKDNP